MKILDKKSLEKTLKDVLVKKGLANSDHDADFQQEQQGKSVATAFENIATKKTDPAQTVKNKALAFLARREYTCKELEKKLLQYNFSGEAESFASNFSCELSDIVTGVINKLCEDNLLSDQRYCEMHLRSRLQKNSGPFKIRMELQQKGVDTALIESLLKNSEVDWFEQAVVAARKKTGVPNSNAIVPDLKARASLQRFLNSRGFSPEHIRYAIETLQAANPSRY